MNDQSPLELPPRPPWFQYDVMCRDALLDAFPRTEGHRKTSWRIVLQPSGTPAGRADFLVLSHRGSDRIELRPHLLELIASVQMIE